MIDNIEIILQNLNDQQKNIARSQDNLLVTACPGSGKTRVLTHKLAYSAYSTPNSMKKVIAITYTNRAADEIKDRLELYGYEHPAIWAGTIHQFCLEYIVYPYAMFLPRLSKGYKIIDEYVSGRYVQEVVDELGLEISFWDRIKINLKLDENSNILEHHYKQVVDSYHKRLISNKEIDFDLILTLSYQILKSHPIASKNISDVIRCLFVDEYQDTNELQYQIIGLLTNANKKINIMFVGDIDQAIYGSLGGVAKNIEEIQTITQLSFKQETLNGCYRSTQRLVDFYAHFQKEYYKVNSLAVYADINGIITLDTTIHKDNVYGDIAAIIKKKISEGVKSEDICVIAPQWDLLYPISRNLRILLPDVEFDAPDISPIKADDMNVFYKFSKLIFTESGVKVHRRKRIATEIINCLTQDYGVNLKDDVDCFWILQKINSIRPSTNNGVEYFSIVVESILSACNIDKASYPSVYESYNDFIEKVNDRVARHNLSLELSLFYKIFKEKNGVVITSCHKIKGEEYHTVIAFGILQGKIPHWDVIINNPSLSDDEARKMIYVIASRAKKELYLIAEQGRTTQSGSPLRPTNVLQSYSYGYDS